MTQATQRVAALERGRRAARVAEAVRVALQGRLEPAPADRATLAEATLGVFLLPIDLWGRAFLTTGLLMTVQSSVTMTKTQRDMHEGTRLVNRIEDARTEKLLMDAGH